MKAFVRSKYDSWCMDLAYVDKLAKEDNGVKFLLVRRDLFDKTVTANGMKKKLPRKRFVRFFGFDYEKYSNQEILGRQGTWICWRA